MKTLVIASQKGGAGKSTIAAHLAVMADLAEYGPTVLIDTDPQGSLSAWWNSRDSDTPSLAGTTIVGLKSKLEALSKSGFKLALIDTPPAITNSIRDVVRLADFVLIPTRPSPHDLRAVGSTVDIVKEFGKPFAFVVTQAKPTARLTVQAVTALSSHGEVATSIVHDRVDYASSMVSGLTVMEVDSKGKSSLEMKALLNFVLERMHKKTKAKMKEVV